MEWILATIALLLAYLVGRLIAALFQKSRCCNAKVRYTLGWNYKQDGNACTKCGMLQD